MADIVLNKIIDDCTTVEWFQAEREDIKICMREAIALALQEAAEDATAKSSSCGDVMTCGCMGTCEHPIISINKQSILNVVNKIV